MDARKLTLIALFSVMIIIEKIIVPAPYDKLISISIQFTLLILGYLIMGLSGSFFISVLSGILLTFVRVEFAFMTLLLSIAYGVLIGLSSRILKVKSGVLLNLRRLVFSSTISSIIIGSISMSVTLAMGFIPFSLSCFWLCLL